MIFLKEPENLLFAYREYRGTDFAADAARMTDDPEARRWRKPAAPCQEPMRTRESGEFRAMTEEVFHVD